MTTRNQLIASVAIQRIKTQLNTESHGTLRICLIGLEPIIVRSIANSLANDPDLSSQIIIKIHRYFDPNDELDETIRSDESITHWRHCPLPDNKRGVLFATTPIALQRNLKSIEKITKIETDSLRTFYKEWINESGLTQDYLDEKNRKILCAALKAANQTNVVRTIEHFADFILKISDATISDGLPLHKAIDYALPQLRLPRNSGQFESIPENRREFPSEWAKIFRRLQRRIRPFLCRENDRGEPLDEVLINNFETVKSELNDLENRIIHTFLESDVTHHGWNSSQKDLVDLDWNSICIVFEGLLENKTQTTLGSRTIDFFKYEFDDPLDEGDRNLLRNDFPKKPTDELKNFFQDHQELISSDKKLYSDWEKYIYGNLNPFNDFLTGLITTFYHLLERTDNDKIVENRINIRIPNSEKRSFWKSKNSKIAHYFAIRYRGIHNFFGNDVNFDFGKLYSFYTLGNFDKELRNNSRTRDARRLKFEVILDPEGIKSKLIFIWEMPADSLATSMYQDLINISTHNGSKKPLLATAKISKQSTSSKGKIQYIDLNDINTICDVNNRNEGSMVAPNSDNGDRTNAIKKAINDLSKYISATHVNQISSDFNEFQETYGKAIQDWVGLNGDGISSNSLILQAQNYARLLESLYKSANTDRARESLWKECLSIGVASVDSATPAAIILPWHPLRMAEIHIKAHQVAELIKSVLHSNKEDIYRADLLFRQKKKELLSNYYPEVCISLSSVKTPILLCLTESSYDYSLAQSPQHNEVQDADHSTGDNPDAAARAISSIGEQYLNLLPHEQNNFSIVLYNTESNRLPRALESELSKKVEQERDLQCDLLLTHSNIMRIRKVYEQQNVAVGDDSGSVRASEATTNFLSRLRVGFLEPGDIPTEDDIRYYDLIALQDVISRNAQIVWKDVPIQQQPDILEHQPPAWTRTKPLKAGNTAATVYLTAPIQPILGQIYLNTIYKYLLGENAQSQNAIPAHEVNFLDSEVSDVFMVAHRLGEWVVNYDKLVDRRFLINNDIQVIRHIHDQNNDRNITVSTQTGHRLLQTLLKKRLNKINPDILNLHGEALIKILIDEANKLSGHVVMRAARHGHFANELLGIVLSMKLLKEGFGNYPYPVGWYFLDDYASWFGQKEEQIADIMAIAPHCKDGKHILKIAIVESKFVSNNAKNSHAKKSSRQLKETISRLTRALDSNHNRIDREMWLNKIGDFIINGMDPFDPTDINGWDLHQWSYKIRQDKVPIYLLGISYVFVHDNTEFIDTDDPVQLNNVDHCYQQFIFKDHISNELKSYDTGQKERQMESIFEDNIWKTALNSTLPENSFTQPPAIMPAKSEPDDMKLTLHSEYQDVDPINTINNTTDKSKSDHKTSENSQNEQSTSHSSSNSALRLPSQGLLNWINEGKFQSQDEEIHWMKVTVTSLQRALRSYHMSSELIDAHLTPNAALIRLRGSDDLTVTKVEKRRQQLLTSHAINVINVIPAPKEVIVMVERPKRAILYLRNLWQKRKLPLSAPELNTSLLLGENEADGELIYLNVENPFAGYSTHGPHTIIAGETGSGKGVLVQCLLLDICATNSPTTARIKMIDPKAGIDFPWLRQMPHLDNCIITSQEDAIESLVELVNEMERRYHLLAKVGVTKLSNYNKKVPAAERLPRIWLFHDELADWMMIHDYRDAVSLNASRLGIKARAAGINLVFISQRPDKDAFPMQLRANMTNRLVLKVADISNSKLVLGEPGAEKLLGRGHIAIKLSGEAQTFFAQVPFADEDEIAELATLICDAWNDRISDES
ncbi:MAG: FtsK/SpoIIIE domain-containing protein [Bacteroidetes bacterium]|nr:FtsK/SpoIIIE domain-containing protein [Bacteroidota bacterium]